MGILGGKRGRPKKELVEEVLSQPESIVEEVIDMPESVGLSALAVMESRRQHLLELREEMVKNGIDTIGKLDVFLSQVNEELRKLSS